jgi:hypothetical protein
LTFSAALWEDLMLGYRVDPSACAIYRRCQESSKDYGSWDDALKEAEQLNLINTVEATAAKALPAGFPLHTTTEMDAGNFANAGFTPGKTSPPQ